MKRIVSILLLVLGTVVPVAAQTPVENPTQEKYSEALRQLREITRRLGERVPVTDEEILTRLEKGILSARFPLSRQSARPERFPAADLNIVLADDSFRVGGRGEIVTKQQEVDQPLTAISELEEVIADSQEIRVHNETGVVTSLLTIKVKTNGKEERKKYRVVNVYLKRNDRWQQITSQMTAIEE